MYQQSQAIHGKANRLYQSAELLLLSSLNLDNFTPSTENTSIKSFSQVDQSGRMDAEYYQLKYDEIEAHIKRKDYTRAYDLLAHNNSMYTPFPQKQYSYIELANIESYGNINDNCSIARGSELPTRARRQVEVDDVIISSIEGSLESCALIPKQYHHALCSTGFYILHSSVINAETLLVLFKSYPVQMLMKRGCNGTILTAISLEELKHVFIPIPEASVQKQVADKVRHSFYLREQSKSLLKAATRAVEIAIEQDESAAVAYLEEQTKGDV